MKKIVIIGDLVLSRNIRRRDKIQTELLSELRRLNKIRSGLISPYTVTLGDEFQAVYSNADSLFSDIFEISAKIQPVKIRFAVSLGEITTRINKKSAMGMDGHVFHNARSCIK